jgi:putative FmdB family regulatory protein
MLMMFDFECTSCDTPFEALAGSDERPPCKNCGSTVTIRVVSSFARPFEVIRATTLTSKQYKAGYVHEYKRPKEKISVSVPA